MRSPPGAGFPLPGGGGKDTCSSTLKYEHLRESSHLWLELLVRAYRVEKGRWRGEAGEVAEGEGMVVLSAAIEEQLIGKHMAPLAWRHGSAAKHGGGEIPEGISEVAAKVPGQYRIREDVWNVCCPATVTSLKTWHEAGGMSSIEHM